MLFRVDLKVEICSLFCLVTRLDQEHESRQASTARDTFDLSDVELLLINRIRIHICTASPIAVRLFRLRPLIVRAIPPSNYRIVKTRAPTFASQSSLPGDTSHKSEQWFFVAEYKLFISSWTVEIPNPPATGVPVPGQSLGSRPSMSKLM